MDEQIDLNGIIYYMVVITMMSMTFKVMGSVYKGMGEPPEPKPIILYPGGPPVGRFLRQK